MEIPLSFTIIWKSSRGDTLVKKASFGNYFQKCHMLPVVICTLKFNSSGKSFHKWGMVKSPWKFPFYLQGIGNSQGIGNWKFTPRELGKKVRGAFIPPCHFLPV